MQFEPSYELTQEKHSLSQKPVLRLLIIGFLFITAFGIRLYNINNPPLDFSPMKQYHSAHIARVYYFETLESIPEWRREVARVNMERDSILEPPIMEHAAVFAYRILGGEQLWVPRLLSSIFWLIGGVFLYLIAKKIASTGAALFSTAFYLFLPFSISASRSFQAEPMMVMMLLFSLFTILRYYEQPSILRLVTAATISALAILIKPFCLFLIFGMFISLAIYRQGIRKSVISPNFLIFAVISLLPPLIYYLNGIFIAGFLKDNARASFLPYLLLHSFFWEGWLTMLGRVVGYIGFIGALFGTLMFRQGLPRALLIGLWTGYFVYGLVFTYHIHTHDYYHLPLIPIVALSLGPIGALVINRLTNQRWLVAILSIILLTVVLGIGLNIRQMQWRDISPDVKTKLKLLGAVFGVNPQFIKFFKPDFEREVKIAQEIGEIVGHSTNTIFLTSDDYGNSLLYHGELSGIDWPTSSVLQAWGKRGIQQELNAEERFKRGVIGCDWIWESQTPKNYSPEYFIVTDFQELEEQADLKDFLARNFPIVVKNDDYLIFDLRGKSNLD